MRFSYDTIDKELTKPAPSPPDTRHWLGTDDQARECISKTDLWLTFSIIWPYPHNTKAIGIIAGASRVITAAKDLFQRFIKIWAECLNYILIIMSSILVLDFGCC